MDRPLTKAILDTGIIDEATLGQLKKWKLLDGDVSIGDLSESMEDVITRIQEALEGSDVVAMRDTDLDAARQFLVSRKRGKLHVPVHEEDDKIISLAVDYCVTNMGEYLMPWKSEGIQSLLTDKRTYLKPLDKPRVYFSDVRELFFGDQKAFLVCTPRE